MKPLTLEETKLKEEMKERCLAKGQYIDENAKAKFEMLCHLEDFEAQYWELQQENKQLRDKIPYIIQNNSCKYISIEKCKNKVCVNYKMQELQGSDSNVKD